MHREDFPPGFADALNFTLLEALHSRRSRRFARGSSIPSGPFVFTSRQEPLPLTELEQMLVLMATAGNTGWHYLLPHHPRFASQLPNYSLAASGRTFPSTAGFHTTELFFTDDQGVYFMATRDAPVWHTQTSKETLDFSALLAAHRLRIRKLADSRLDLPTVEPYMEGLNTWCVNCPGSLFIIPVADVAQHFLASLCFRVQNGSAIYDDVHQERIPGLERFRHLIDTEHPARLTLAEQGTLHECVTELSIACYAGMLMLQAIGLGGWMFTGVNRYAILGASGNPAVPGLGFRYDTQKNWPVPNPTGLPGVFEGFCPPHYPDMRAAVKAVVQRKFGPGGPFHPDTPGPWKESRAVRGKAPVHDEDFQECVALIAQYIYDRFGKFPGTVPTIFSFTYLQAHHLDLEFYDRYFVDGAYLRTHAQHMAQWHPDIQ